MMIKIFTADKDGKVTFTVDELKQLLYEAFQEGYHSKGISYISTIPDWNSPYITYTTISSPSDNGINLIIENAGDLKNEI